MIAIEPDKDSALSLTLHTIMGKNKYKEAVIDTLTKFNQTEYITKFVKETYKRYEVRLNRSSDADLIDFIDSQENKTEYIK